MPELSSHVDVCSLGTHGESDHQCSLNQLVRVSSENFPVLTGAGLGLVGVDD